ncbi:MAG: RNA helicase [Pedobacter sp.]|nr:MAG: RNA helicase [Pedobacter sp.]
MPISEIDGLAPSHWSEVLNLLTGSAEKAGFSSKLVSESSFSGVIQQRIIQNLYQNEVVICDVSGQNPNVMFELGLRLAFDKATIVIVDDKTKISFDTAPIEHLIYPRDLRHGKIVDFTERLTEMIKATYAESKKDGYSTFLKHFGQFDLKGLQNKEGGVDAYMLTLLQDVSEQISSLRLENDRNKSLSNRVRTKNYNIPNGFTLSMIRNIVYEVLKIRNIKLSEETDLFELSIDVQHSRKEMEM